VVNAAGANLRDLRNKINLYKVALKSLTKPTEDLFAEIKSLELELNDIQRKLYGDRTLMKIDQDAEPGLAGRVNQIIYEQWDSFAAPTQTQKDAYKIVADEFPPLLEKLKQLAENNAKNIEKKLEELGAPYTPGRWPEWKK
jgi:predicted  nucleic acid-binding Zn-ribbon protein